MILSSPKILISSLKPSVQSAQAINMILISLKKAECSFQLKNHWTQIICLSRRRNSTYSRPWDRLESEIFHLGEAAALSASMEDSWSLLVSLGTFVILNQSQENSTLNCNRKILRNSQGETVDFPKLEWVLATVQLTTLEDTAELFRA